MKPHPSSQNVTQRKGSGSVAGGFRFFSAQRWMKRVRRKDFSVHEVMVSYWGRLRLATR